MNIAVFSEDNFLINYLTKTFENVMVNNGGFNYDTVVVLDNVKKDIKASTIINISNNITMDRAVNIKPPFKLDDLTKKIKEAVDYINNNIFSFNGYFIDKGKNILFFNNLSIQLTTKEMELVCYLYHTKNANKINILKNVWNIENKDNKSLETMIYNIKQKTSNDFIICNDGLYSLGGLK